MARIADLAAVRVMRLVPFVAVDGIPFAITPAQMLARFGTPRHQQRTPVGLVEYDYGVRVFRFQDSGRLEEITQQVDVLHVGDEATPFAAIAALVRAQDDAAFERAGFLVSPRYGIAFVPGAPDWLTALAAHCIPTWRALT